MGAECEASWECQYQFAIEAGVGFASNKLETANVLSRLQQQTATQNQRTGDKNQNSDLKKIIAALKHTGGKR